MPTSTTKSPLPQTRFLTDGFFPSWNKAPPVGVPLSRVRRKPTQLGDAGTTESAGFIATYDLATGKFDGLLQDASGQPLVIQGIWSLAPGNVSPSSLDPDDAPLAQVYFTAGPNEETTGLFGYLTAVPTELTQGSDH